MFDAVKGSVRASVDPSPASLGGSEAFVRRLERDAVLAGVALTVGALIVHPPAALGVVGGVLLIVFSYRALKSVALMLTGAVDRRRRRVVWELVKFFTRHAILAVAAYLMVVRLHLHPIGMLAGASIFVLAAATAAIRELRAQSPGPP